MSQLIAVVAPVLVDVPDLFSDARQLNLKEVRRIASVGVGVESRQRLEGLVHDIDVEIVGKEYPEYLLDFSHGAAIVGDVHEARVGLAQFAAKFASDSSGLARSAAIAARYLRDSQLALKYSDLAVRADPLNAQALFLRGQAAHALASRIPPPDGLLSGGAVELLEMAERDLRAALQAVDESGVSDLPSRGEVIAPLCNVLVLRGKLVEANALVRDISYAAAGLDTSNRIRLLETRVHTAYACLFVADDVIQAARYVISASMPFFETGWQDLQVEFEYAMASNEIVERVEESGVDESALRSLALTWPARFPHRAQDAWLYSLQVLLKLGALDEVQSQLILAKREILGSDAVGRLDDIEAKLHMVHALRWKQVALDERATPAIEDGGEVARLADERFKHARARFLESARAAVDIWRELFERDGAPINTYARDYGSALITLTGEAESKAEQAELGGEIVAVYSMYAAEQRQSMPRVRQSEARAENGVAYGHYVRGDLESAREHAQNAVDLHPEYLPYQAGLRNIEQMLSDESSDGR